MIRLLLIALSLAGPLSTANAEDLGVRAQTYKPDPDAREQLRASVRALGQNKIDKFWQEYQQKTIASIKNPAPLPGVTTSYQPKTVLRELKFTFNQDILDQTGRVTVRKGTVVEPLKIQPLTTGLIFIDGRDQRQIDYAIKRGRMEPLKIVLTAGSAFNLRKKYEGADWWGGTKNIPFYFDQRKMFINTMQRQYGIDLNLVPVALTQSGHQLKLEYGMR